MLEMKCYTADHVGELKMANEIESMEWWTYADRDRASEAGVRILDWLKGENCID